MGAEWLLDKVGLIKATPITTGDVVSKTLNAIAEKLITGKIIDQAIKVATKAADTRDKTYRQIYNNINGLLHENTTHDKYVQIMSVDEYDGGGGISGPLQQSAMQAISQSTNIVKSTVGAVSGSLAKNSSVSPLVRFVAGGVKAGTILAEVENIGEICTEICSAVGQKIAELCNQIDLTKLFTKRLASQHVEQINNLIRQLRQEEYIVRNSIVTPSMV